ncbi:MAG: aldehyde dehydrogenase family protein [Bacteroidales bacterium]|nr:aldehyde dehydrogenase family protein [Bacteroidales bacterium]
MTDNRLEIFFKQKDYIKEQNSIPIAQRIEILKRLRELIRSNEEKIKQALSEDLHKNPTEAYMTEIGITLSEINYCIKHLKSWAKIRRKPSSILLFPSKAFVYPQAKGNILIISPWNYPFQLSILPLVGAISAGNTVILSPSSQSVATNKLLQELINSNFDRKQLFCTDGNKNLSTEILKQGVNHLFFTGSYKTAQYLHSICSENLISTTFELGGKSPLIIDKDSNLSIAAKRVCLGKFINCGQTCIAPDYLFVHKEVKEEFINLLKENIISFFGIKASESENYGRIINQKQFLRLKNLLAQGEIIFGGNYNEQNNYISPTLIKPYNLNSSLMQEEIFGPILPVLEFEEIESVIKHINSAPRPLALYYFGTKNANIIKQTISGGVCINDAIMHIIPHNLPFGGIGQSGMGAYHGKKSFDTFSHYKSVLKTHKNFEFKIKYPPYTSLKQKIIRLFMDR